MAKKLSQEKKLVVKKNTVMEHKIDIDHVTAINLQ